MSRFTSEDLMKAMGLSVGDRVKVNNKIYIIIKLENCYFLEEENANPIIKINHWQNIVTLINFDYEILPRPKRVGDLECNNDCGNCPLRILPSCKGCGIKTLYKILETYKMISKDESYFDQEIHDLLKARLDKEVCND